MTDLIVAMVAGSGLLGTIIYGLLASKFDDRYMRKENCDQNHAALDRCITEIKSSMLRLEEKIDGLIQSIVNGHVIVGK